MNQKQTRVSETSTDTCLECRFGLHMLVVIEQNTKNCFLNQSNWPEKIIKNTTVLRKKK